jgi:CO/xanthine dehydrogenase FAD-binding subunit
MVYIRTPNGIETMELYSLYQNIPPLEDLRVGGLITAIAVPMKSAGETVRSAVLTRRASLDYPEIAVAIRHMKQDSRSTETTIVMTAPLPRPSRYVVTESQGDTNDHMMGWLESVIPAANTGLYGPEYLRMAAYRLISRTMISDI